jgi:hypothetical protein
LAIGFAEAILSLQDRRFATCPGELDSGSLAMASRQGRPALHDPARAIPRPALSMPGLPVAT